MIHVDDHHKHESVHAAAVGAFSAIGAIAVIGLISIFANYLG